MSDSVKKDNKKAFRKFLLMMLLSGSLGALGSFFGMNFFRKLEQVFSAIEIFFTTYAAFMLVGWTIILAAVGVALYIFGKRDYERMDPDTDELPEKGEKLFSYCLLLSSSGMIVTFFLFTAGVMNISGAVNYDIIKNFAILMVGFIASSVISLMLQKACVDFLRRTNPEKRGSVFDTKFTEKWVDSCDEAEQLNIYKSAYKAYKTGSITCVSAWLMLFIWSLCAGQSMLLPSFLVLMIWGVQQVTYVLESMRLDKAKK